jgi:hypothetical protein
MDHVRRGPRRGYNMAFSSSWREKTWHRFFGGKRKNQRDQQSRCLHTYKLFGSGVDVLDL